MDNVPSGAGPVRFDPSKAVVIALWCLSALFSRKERCAVVCVLRNCVCACVRGEPTETSLQHYYWALKSLLTCEGECFNDPS